MPRTLGQWFALALACIIAGNLLAFAGVALQAITDLHPTIIVALMVLFGAALSATGFLVDWIRH